MTKPEALYRPDSVRPVEHQVVGYVLLLTFVAVGMILLSGCTYVKTETLTVIDFHPVGGLTEIEATKPDGTRINASRGQGSAEGLVSGVVDAATGI